MNSTNKELLWLIRWLASEAKFYSLNVKNSKSDSFAELLHVRWDQTTRILQQVTRSYRLIRAPQREDQ